MSDNETNERTGQHAVCQALVLSHDEQIRSALRRKIGRRWILDLDGGTKPTLAKLSLARMIAATVLRMWKNEEEYDPGRAGLPTQTRKG